MALFIILRYSYGQTDVIFGKFRQNCILDTTLRPLHSFLHVQGWGHIFENYSWNESYFLPLVHCIILSLSICMGFHELFGQFLMEEAWLNLGKEISQLSWPDPNIAEQTIVHAYTSSGFSSFCLSCNFHCKLDKFLTPNKVKWLAQYLW